MTVKLQRPILVGGVGLSLVLWLWQSLHPSVIQLGEFSLLPVVLFSGFWLLQPHTSNKIKATKLAFINRQTVEKAIAQTDTLINQLATEITDQEPIILLRQKLTNATIQLDRNQLTLAVTGGKGVGKTSLKQVLDCCSPQKNWHWQEIPALFTTNAEPENPAQDLVASDLVLFVTAGDLTDSEFQALQQLIAANQQILLILNKQDQFLPAERVTLLQQLKTRMTGLLAEEDVIGTAAMPAPVKVRKHQPDASVQEWIETQKPELTSLQERLTAILTLQAEQLVWATTYRTMMALQAEVKTQLNQQRRDRALPIIEQYQWIAAAAAFANPVPALDLLATAAISGQLVIELGAIYQQKFSLQQAQTTAKTLASLILKLGLVELSTQTIGGILKSNAFTYIAGGAVQGVSAAYLTRLAGLSLIEYFQEQEDSALTTTEKSFNFERLGQKLQAVFQQNQRTALLQNFVQAAVVRVVPSIAPAKTCSD